MKKIFLFMLLFVGVYQVNAQTAIQEFNFNGTLSNIDNTISFLGTANYVKDRAGVANSAIRVNNSILEATISNLPLSNYARTVSIWVKYNDVATANYIWGYGSLTNAQYFGLLQQATTASTSDLNLAGWGPTNDVIVTTTIVSGTWYNYTVTYDGLTSKIYRNGELIKSSISPRKLTSAKIFGIGRMGSAVSINADIDDLKIYNVALSADEVAALFENASVSLSNNNDLLSETSDVSNYKVVTKPQASTSTKIANASASKSSNIILSTPVETLPNKTTEIYSSQGYKIYSGDKNKIDVTKLPEGSYLLKVFDTEESNTDKKITAN